MASSQNKADLAVDTPPEGMAPLGAGGGRGGGGDRDDDRPRGGGGGGGESRRAAAPVSAFHIYKPGQGSYVRWCSAAGAGLIAVAGAGFAYEQLTGLPLDESVLLTVRTAIAVGLLVGLGYLIFRFVGQHHGVVDFLIATEGEMKKVNWSTRKEVIGATKVVIMTLLALGVILFLVDIFFILFFDWIGVLRINIIGKMFGVGAPS